MPRSIAGRCVLPTMTRVALATMACSLLASSAAATTELARHRRAPHSIALGPDGRTVATLDGTTGLIWNLDSLVPQAAFAGVERGLVFSPDGRTLYGRERNGTIRWFEVATGRERGSFKGIAGDTLPMALSADGRELALGLSDGTVAFYGLPKGELTGRVAMFEGQGHVTSLAYDPRGRFVAAGSSRGFLNQTDLPKKDTASRARVQGGPLLSLTIARDGSRLLTGSLNDSTVRLWDARTEKQVASFQALNHNVAAAVLSPNGSKVAIAAMGTHGVPVYDVATKARIEIGGMGGEPVDLLFSGDGSKLLVIQRGTPDIDVFETRTGRKVGTFAGERVVIPTQVAAAPQGDLFAIAAQPDLVQVYDAGGKLLRQLTPHTKEVTALAFSPDGKALFTGGKDRIVVALQTQDWKQTGRFAVSDDVDSVGVSRDGKLLAVASGNRVTFFSQETSARRAEARIGEGYVLLSALAFSPDGKTLVAGGLPEATLFVIDVETGRVTRKISHRARWIRGVAFSPDGRTVYAAGTEWLLAFDLATGKETASAAQDPDVQLVGLSLSNDGKLLTSGTRSKNVSRSIRPMALVFDARTLARRWGLEGHQGSVVGSAFAARGQRLFSAGSAGELLVHDLRSGKLISRMNAVPGVTTAVEAAPQAAGAAHQASLPPAPPIRARNTASDAEAALTGGAEVVVQKGHSRTVEALAFDTSGRLLASASQDATVRLWDTRTGLLVRVLSGHEKEVLDVDISPNGARVLSASDDFTWRLWDTTSGALIRTMRQSGQVLAARFLSDDKLITLDFQGTVRVWDAKSGEELRMMTAPKGRALALSHDRSHVAVAQDDGVSVFELGSGKLAGTLTGIPGRVLSVAFSPDDEKIVAGGEARALHVWAWPSGRGLGAIAGHAGALESVSFVDAHTVSAGAIAYRNAKLDKTLSLGDGPTLHFYDLRRMRQVHSVTSTSRGVAALAMQPGTPTLAYAEGAKIHLYDSAERRELVPLGAQSLAVRDAAFGANDFLAVATPEGVNVIDLATGRDRQPLTAGESGRAVRVAASADGSRLALLSEEPLRLDVFDRGRNEIIRGFDRLPIIPTSLAFAPNGKHVVASFAPGPILLFDLEAGTRRQLSPKPSSYAVAFSGDGERVYAALSDGTVAGFEVASGRRVVELRVDLDGFSSLAVSPDGKVVAAGSHSGKVYAWLLPNQQPLPEIKLAGRTVVSALAFDGEGRLWAGRDDGELVALDLAGGKTLHSQRPHGSRISRLDPSPDGKRLAAASWDGSVTIIETESATELVRVLAPRLGASVMVTPAQHYSAAREALGSLAFRLGTSAYSFEQFDLLLNRPDKVAERLGLASPEVVRLFARARQKRLARMGFSETDLTGVRALPEVSLVGRIAPVSRSCKVPLTVEAKSPASQITRLHVWVNDVPVLGTTGVEPSKRSAQVRHELHVDLAAGRNRIQVAAVDAGGVESLKASAQVTCERPASSRLWVLGIGVSRYAKDELNLDYAAKDARDLASVLTQAGGAETTRVQLLVDEEVTRERILASRRFLEQAAVDDRVVVFVAGHGFLDDEGAYAFGTSDIDPERPAARGLAYEELEGLLDGLRARHKLLLLDTCHSGEVDPDMLEPRAIGAGMRMTTRPSGARGLGRKSRVSDRQLSSTVASLFAELRRGSGAQVIASSGGAEYAIETAALKNGVFTWAVLEALRGESATPVRDGNLTVGALRGWVARRVPELSLGQQTPSVRRESVEFDFALPVLKRR